MFLDILGQSALEKCTLDPSEPVLVGVSGGADSLALLIGLEKLGYKLVAAHLDHGLRVESAQDADFVQHLAADYGLPFVRERVDVRAAAQAAGQSIEESARHVRYRFLFAQARAHQAQAVAVAHHADDQVETVLMHFLRGAARPGLSGMPYRRRLPLWDDTIPLVRPLLGVWREQIDAFLAEQGVTPREDASNQDTTYFRNRLRHDLIPELETYNPQFRQAVCRMAAVLGEEDRLLEAQAEDAWQVCFNAKTDERVELYLHNFLALPTALQRRVLRGAVGLLRPDLRDVGFEAVERGLNFAADPPDSGEIDLAARLNLAVLGDLLIVKTWSAELPDWGKPRLAPGSEGARLDPAHPVTLRHGWQLTAALIAEVPEDMRLSFRNGDPAEAWLDAGRLSLPLTVRGRQAGDRWHPLGMAGHTQGLKDFFINEKVPEHLREDWPLVCSAGQIVWVVGVRPSEAFKITEKTRQVLHLRVVKSGE